MQSLRITCYFKTVAMYVCTRCEVVAFIPTSVIKSASSVTKSSSYTSKCDNIIFLVYCHERPTVSAAFLGIWPQLIDETSLLFLTGRELRYNELA